MCTRRPTRRMHAVLTKVTGELAGEVARRGGARRIGRVASGGRGANNSLQGGKVRPDERTIARPDAPPRASAGRGTPRARRRRRWRPGRASLGMGQKCIFSFCGATPCCRDRFRANAGRCCCPRRERTRTMPASACGNVDVAIDAPEMHRPETLRVATSGAVGSRARAARPSSNPAHASSAPVRNVRAGLVDRLDERHNSLRHALQAACEPSNDARAVGHAPWAAAPGCAAARRPCRSACRSARRQSGRA